MPDYVDRRGVLAWLIVVAVATLPSCRRESRLIVDKLVAEPEKGPECIEIAKRYMAQVAHELLERYIFHYGGPYDPALYKVEAVFAEDLKEPGYAGSRSGKSRVLLVDWVNQTVTKSLGAQ